MKELASTKEHNGNTLKRENSKASYKTKPRYETQKPFYEQLVLMLMFVKKDSFTAWRNALQIKIL